MWHSRLITTFHIWFNTNYGRKGETNFTKIIQPVRKQVNKEIRITSPGGEEMDKYLEFLQCYLTVQFPTKKLQDMQRKSIILTASRKSRH